METETSKKSPQKQLESKKSKEKEKDNQTQNKSSVTKSLADNEIVEFMMDDTDFLGKQASPQYISPQ